MSTAAFDRLLSETETALALGRSLDDLDALFGTLVQRAMELPGIGADMAQLVAAAWSLCPHLADRAAAQRTFDDLTSAMRSLLAGGRAEVERLVEAARAASGDVAPADAEVEQAGTNAPADGIPTFDDGDRQLVSEFILESTESMDTAEQSMLRLEDHADIKEHLDGTFRAFHSVKGVAGFLRLTTVTELAHAIESLMDRARKGEFTPDEVFVDIVLRGIDRIRQMLAWLEPLSQAKPAAGPCPPQADLVRAALDYRPGSRTIVAPAPETPAADLGAAPFEAPAAPAPSDLPAEPVPTAPAPPPPEAFAAPAPAAEATRGPETARRVVAPQVKVDTEKLDALVDLVGELLIVQSMVVADPEVAKLQSQGFARNLSQLVRISKDLQRTAMAMRTVPIGGLFEKMNRVAREAGKATGKHVNLLIEGGDTELDRTVVEVLHDPLVHMIRNAVDHGIEAPEGRREAGKPDDGVVKLSARHEGGQIVVEIRDDGKGLNAEKLINRARERGLIGPNDQLTEQQAFQIIFAPGFSMAAKVTDISGRGVGMDVVKTNVERVRGRVEVDSQLGHGSVFRIRLPLTLAIIDGLVVRVGDERYILPTEWAREAIRPQPEDISSVFGAGDMLNVRGQLVRLVRLGDVFGVEGAQRRAEKGLVVLVEGMGQRRGLVVDELLGRQEVVIKSLGESLGKISGVAGGAILGDGRVGLILDVRDVLSLQEGVAVDGERAA
ncbi:chemotaxis protein CheA [Myxococcota bacterium]|nr:chemotaxis protein CheA [Myxococcota bacterium]